MGAVFSSGYCNPVDVANKGSVVISAYLFASIPAVALLIPVIMMCVPRSKHSTTWFLQVMDFRPPMRSRRDKENRVVYRMPRSPVGGLISLVLLSIVAVAIFFIYVVELTPAKLVPSVQLDLLRPRLPIPYSMLAVMYCPTTPTLTISCSNLTLNMPEVSCVQNNDYCQLSGKANYTGEAAIEIAVSMPSAYNALNPQHQFTMQLSADIQGRDEQGQTTFRSWNPVGNIEDYLVFTDSCLYMQNIPLGQNVTTITNARVRKNCQATPGPRFACGSNYLSGAYNDVSLAFSPDVYFSSYGINEATATAILYMTVDTKNQYSTALPSYTIFSQVLQILPKIASVVSFGIVAQPILRYPILYSTEQWQLRRRGTVIARRHAFLAAFVFLVFLGGYVLTSFLFFFLCQGSTFQPPLLAYSNSKLGIGTLSLEAAFTLLGLMCAMLGLSLLSSFLFYLYLRGWIFKPKESVEEAFLQDTDSSI